MEITLEERIDFAEVFKFLEEINDDVFPAINSRVNLSSYADKIANFAECLVIKENNEIKALSAFYCNDLKSKTGYLTLIGVSRSLRNQGVAVKLLNETITVAKSKGMQKLVLETNNRNYRAVRLYENYGFKVFKTEPDGALLMEHNFFS